MALLADILEEADRLEGESKVKYLRHEINTLKDVIFLLETTVEAIPAAQDCKEPTRLTHKEIDFIQRNKKIMAIKEVRARTKCGLAEAKKAVEDWMTRR